MIRSGTIIRSVRRASWDEHSAALLSRAGEVENFAPFELLSVNHDSYALVRNVRGCIYLGAYAGRGVFEFVAYILQRGYSCIFSTRYVRQAMRVFSHLYTECMRDSVMPERCWFFIPSRAGAA
jgi:hypothetical protein